MTQEPEIKLSRRAELLLQAHLRREGCVVTFGNKENLLTKENREAFKELIQNGVCSYKRDNNVETITCIKTMNGAVWNNPMTQEEDYFLMDKNATEFVPIIE